MTTIDEGRVLTGVLIPIRSFDDAKSRLDGALDDAARIELMRSLVRRTVGAAHGLPVWVVTDDREVAAWAPGQGAIPLAVDRDGLDESVTAGRDALRARGLDRIIVAHADLARARDLSVVDGQGFGIAPDRHRDGSNVLSIPLDVDFGFAYGAGSFERHVAEAERLGLPIRVVDDPTLAIDIDEPEDLRFVDEDEEP